MLETSVHRCAPLQIDQHPGGGARIMLAAGGAIDPFWAMYAQHQTAEVRKILEGFRIGDLVSQTLHDGSSYSEAYLAAVGCTAKWMTHQTGVRLSRSSRRSPLAGIQTRIACQFGIGRL